MMLRVNPRALLRIQIKYHLRFHIAISRLEKYACMEKYLYIFTPIWLAFKCVFGRCGYKEMYVCYFHLTWKSLRSASSIILNFYRESVIFFSVKVTYVRCCDSKGI